MNPEGFRGAGRPPDQSSEKRYSRSLLVRFLAKPSSPSTSLMVWALLLLQVPDLLLDRAGGDEAVGVDRAGLADAVGAVDGLGFDGGIPPRIVQHDVAGGGEVEAGAGGAEGEEEHGGACLVVEGADHFLPVLGIAGEYMGGDVAGAALAFEDLSISTNWEKTRTFSPFSMRGSSNSKSVSVLPEAESLPTREGWQQIWRSRVRAASTCMRLWARPLVGQRLHDLIAAATEFGEVQHALGFAEVAVAAFLDAVGQILGDLLLEAAQHERAELRGEAPARDALGGGVVATLRLVGFVEVTCVPR
jgi:hypothetical protein